MSRSDSSVKYQFLVYGLYFAKAVYGRQVNT